jgi:hypothetical protein
MRGGMRSDNSLLARLAIFLSQTDGGGLVVHGKYYTKNSAVGTPHDLRRVLGCSQDGRWCGAPIDEIAHAINDFPSCEVFGALARLEECLIRAIDQARRAVD